jgi:hypothetical protein
MVDESSFRLKVLMFSKWGPKATNTLGTLRWSIPVDPLSSRGDNIQIINARSKLDNPMG